MNTLSRQHTAQFFASAENRQYLRAQWRTLINSSRRHELGPQHHFLYLALMGKDWRKAFTPCRSPSKLANGALVGWVLWQMLRDLYWASHRSARMNELLAPFDGHVSIEMVKAVSLYLPRIDLFAMKPEYFAHGYPFDAYWC